MQLKATQTINRLRKMHTRNEGLRKCHNEWMYKHFMNKLIYNQTCTVTKWMCVFNII